MKSFIPVFLMTLAGAPQAFAESGRLAPVYDSSAISGRVGASSAQPMGGRNMFETLDRLEQLQAEVQQLRGVIEEQAYKISELEKRQEAMYLDVDQRFQSLGKPEASIEAPVDNLLPGVTPPVDSVDSSITLPEKKVQQIPAITPPVDMPVSKPATATATPEINPNVASTMPTNRATYKRPVLDEKQAYQQAYETLRTGSTIKSIELFKQFLVDYPRGSYADNASYWLAEAYKLNRQIDQARLTFQNLINRFPNSPKVPDAKLKLGFIEAELNNLDQARRILTDITVSYPGTSVAYLASKKLAEINRY